MDFVQEWQHQHSPKTNQIKSVSFQETNIKNKEKEIKIFHIKKLNNKN